MTGMGTCSFPYLLLLTFLHGVFAQEKCDQSQTSLIAKFTPQNFTSHGYPNAYPREDMCTWVIQAATTGEEYAMQLYASDLGLNKAADDCTGTYVEIRQGKDLGSATESAKWCGSGPKVFRSSQKTVVILFHSDSSQPGRGFSIDYNMIDAGDLSCAKDNQGLISVGRSPVIATFSGKANVQKCQWRIQDQNMYEDSRLEIELITASNIPCNLGRYILYEGESDTGHVSYTSCATSQLFSMMFLSSNVAILKLENFGSEVYGSLVLRISRRRMDASANCDDNQHHIYIPDQPVFFALPFSANSGGESCPVHLQTQNEGMQLRIDVLGSDETEAKCADSLITVSGPGPKSNPVEAVCLRENLPVYFADMNNATVTKSSSASRVFLRVTAQSPDCNNGLGETMVAVRDLSVDVTLPNRDGYKNLGRCVRLIRTESPDDVVYLKLNWTSPQDELAYPTSSSGTCQGDILNVYDGDLSTSALVYSSCSGVKGERAYVETTVVSTQSHLYVLLEADEKIPGQSVKLEYHAVPASQSCKAQTVKVGRTAKVITSTNYPEPLPLNQRCMYDLVADNSDETIIVKVIDSNLLEKCQSMLMLKEGGYQVEGKTTRKETRICGRLQGKIYKLQGKKAHMVSHSDDENSPGGWKVEVYTESASSQQSKTGGNSGLWYKGSVLFIVSSFVSSYLVKQLWH